MSCWTTRIRITVPNLPRRLARHFGRGTCDALTGHVPTVIDRDTVVRLLDEGAQLVDVLDPEEFADAHIEDAINIHLKTLNARTTGVLDKARPVITSCHDFQ